MRYAVLMFQDMLMKNCLVITEFVSTFKITWAVVVAFIIVYNIGYYNGEFTYFLQHV